MFYKVKKQIQINDDKSSKKRIIKCDCYEIQKLVNLRVTLNKLNI